MSPSDRAVVSELATFDRLLEVGIGRRPAVARALGTRGCEVIAIDIDDAAVEPESTADRPYRTCRGDVVRLADAADPIASLPVDIGNPGAPPDAEASPDAEAPPDAGIDAVYALNLPAELQRPAVRLADRLDAACWFTTLGFEAPVVAVRRRQIEAETLYAARDREDERRRPGRTDVD